MQGAETDIRHSDSAGFARTAPTGSFPPVGAADRPRSSGRRVVGNPWLVVGIVAGFLLVCTWVAWAVHVWSDHGAREGLGVLIVWPAIVAVLAVLAMPFVWAFTVIRSSGRSGEQEPREEPESAEEATEPG
jgi:hypothetical protein